MGFLSELKLEILAGEQMFIEEQWDNNAPHIAPFNRFYYMLKGNATVKVRGKTLLLQEKHAYILPIGILLQLIRPKMIFEHIYFHFNAILPGGGDFFSFFDCPLELSGSLISRYLSSKWWKNFPFGDDNGVLDELNREAMLRLLINPFIAEGIKRTPEKEEALERFEKVIAYIEKHYQKKIKTAELAALTYLHPTYFSNLFTSHFGVAPKHYISQVRMRKAQYMLNNSVTLIKNIAEKIGYNDELYFSRIFKKFVGISPTEYRHQRRLNPF